MFISPSKRRRLADILASIPTSRTPLPGLDKGLPICVSLHIEKGPDQVPAPLVQTFPIPPPSVGCSEHQERSPSSNDPFVFHGFPRTGMHSQSTARSLHACSSHACPPTSTLRLASRRVPRRGEIPQPDPGPIAQEPSGTDLPPTNGCTSLSPGRNPTRSIPQNPAAPPEHPNTPPPSPLSSITVACYNLGGPCITTERFGHSIQAMSKLYPELPRIVCLGEFKPTGAPLYEYEWMATVTSRGQYHLLSSIDPIGRNGIALLVHQDLSPHGPPQCSVILPARIISFDAKIHSDPEIPPVSFVAIYGSCIKSDRVQIQNALTPLLDRPTLMFGDMNAISRLEDVCDVSMAYAQKLVWPWMRDLEQSGGIIDLMRVAYQDIPPKTRYRGHPGRSRLDHILVTKSLLPLLTPHSPSTSPLTLDQQPLSDHDMVSVSIAPWTQSHVVPQRCQGWGRKHVKQFQALCAEFHPNLPPESMDSMPCSEQTSLMVDLQQHMLRCMEVVNATRPSKVSPPLPEWAAHVRSLLRLARRNPKLFFRRVRNNGLTTMCNPCPPMNPAFLTSLVQETMPFDPSVVQVMATPARSLPDLPTPTDAELFQCSRVPRAKSPGPDGVPPYLYYILPQNLFHLFANCIRSSLSLECPLPFFFDATLIGLYKPKKDWWAPNAWRPIAMSTAGYRIGMRFVKRHISEWTFSFLSGSQFGSRPGRSTAAATFCLLESINAGASQGATPHAVFLDVRNAFSSVPFALMEALLEHLRFPKSFVQLFSHILRRGQFHVPAHSEPFHASSGIRQGCPLSAMLFVLFYEMALRLLSRWHPIAFVDDLVAVAFDELDARLFISHAHWTLQRMGLDLNASKSEILILGSTTPTEITIPAMPECNLCQWHFQPRPAPGSTAPPILPCSPPPAQPDIVITTSLSVLHLGHHLTSDLKPESMYQMVMKGVQDVFDQFHQRPLPLYARLKVLNQVIAPQILYRLECIPPMKASLDHLGTLTRKFLLALTDVPSFLVSKTLFSHRKVGLGALHLPTLVPQRVLDVAHRTIRLLEQSTSPTPKQGWLVACISACRTVLGVPGFTASGDSVQPRAEATSTPCLHLTSVDLPCYERHHSLHLPAKTAFADGSFFPSVAQCAASVVLPDQRAFVLRPRGKASCYRAEVYALALAVDVVGHGFTILTDSAAALAAIKGSSPRVTLAHPIAHIRNMVAEKQLILQHVRGHIGVEGNEMADKLAKEACLSIPVPPSQVSCNPWDICVVGELQSPPHKTWIRDLTPHHSQCDIHPWSWKPVTRAGWLPWLFGSKSIKGYAHPSTYWRNQSSPTPCPYCSQFHNASVHGVIGLCQCPEAHPLVQAWLQGWGPHQHLVASWRLRANPRDRFLLGKLVFPDSLITHLKEMLGARIARSAVARFHRTVLPLLHAVLPHWSPEERRTFKRKLNPYDPMGWDRGPGSLPTQTSLPRRVRRTLTSMPSPSQQRITSFFPPASPALTAVHRGPCGQN